MIDPETQAVRTALIATVMAIAQTMTPDQKRHLVDTYLQLGKEAQSRGQTEYANLLLELHRLL